MPIYLKFFSGKSGRMTQEQFKLLCEECLFDAECVECKANDLGFSFDKTSCFNIALIDMIGFEYPFEVYDIK